MRVFGDRLLGIIVIGVLLTTCILPSLGIFILYKTGHISDFRLHNRTERTVPYIINFVCYIACYLYLYRFGIPNWILSFIAGAIVSLIISLFINRYWKISAHMVAAGAMVVLVFLMSIYRLMLTPYIFPLQITIILLAGVRCADKANISNGISHSSSSLAAFSMIGRSDVLPIIILTIGFIININCL